MVYNLKNGQDQKVKPLSATTKQNTVCTMRGSKHAVLQTGGGSMMLKSHAQPTKHLKQDGACKKGTDGNAGLHWTSSAKHTSVQKVNCEVTMQVSDLATESETDGNEIVLQRHWIEL